MNAGFGTGVMYMTEACLERYPPVIGGSNAYQLAQRLPDTRPSLRNYEPGHLNLPGLLILEAAIEQKQALGLRQIEAHNRALLERLLASLPADLRSADAGRDSLGSFLALRDRSGLYSRLTEGGVVCLKRGEHVRLGFHFYNTEAEADRLLELIHR